ncbi:MAG: GNAT family N-acetyltransferase [Bacteroidia bacterium]
MDQNNFSEIKTERLFLRKLEQSDWEMISYLRTDKIVNKLVKRPGAGSKEKALEFINKTNEGIDRRDLFYWSISEKDKAKMIGSICLWNFSKDRKTAEVGYDLSPEFHGKGLMNEALQSVVDFGFNKLGLNSIEAYTHRENSSSVKLLERNKFRWVESRSDEDNGDNIILVLNRPEVLST